MCQARAHYLHFPIFYPHYAVNPNYHGILTGLYPSQVLYHDKDERSDVKAVTRPEDPR